jgi:hypothetical protein
MMVESTRNHIYHPATEKQSLILNSRQLDTKETKFPQAVIR